MPYTKHGHPFGVIDTNEPAPGERVRCGGIEVCQECKAETWQPDRDRLNRLAEADTESEAYRQGYRDGREAVAEEIAREMEREFVAGATRPAWMEPGGTLTAQSIQQWAAGIARNFKQ